MKWQKMNKKNEGMAFNLFISSAYTMKKKYTLNWLPLPEEHDYPAAASYLSLIYNESVVEKNIKDLRKAEIVQFKAKDIFRASWLSLLGVSNSHVKKIKIKYGQELQFHRFF